MTTIGAMVLIPTAFLLLVGAAVWLRGPNLFSATSAILATEPDFVGGAACLSCHEQEAQAWIGSHHDLAMALATDETVLGDFNDVVFEHRGMRARFFREQRRFMVETQNATGVTQSFEVAYTFGVTPLQQYLIGFPDGRYQALTVAWDARPAEAGGQRWFHLQPNEDAPPGDELHWTAPAYNWNYACAECHSTNLQKHYDAASDTFATTWGDMDVSCEACHGPGSRHVALATAREANPAADYPPDGGLVVDAGGPGDWQLVEGAATAGLAAGAGNHAQVEMCARCHSRRLQVGVYEFAESLLDSHWTSLLDDGLYFADGQIRDEVYVYGSFLQSRMYALGVTCSDCHDPHSLKIRAPGNGVCTNCHSAARFDAKAHHFHEPGTQGASCVECHMPSRTYMVVDPRRDHSMRIPRPDLSVALGVPNACTQCHDDKSAQWAADAVIAWYGSDFQPGTQTFAHAFAQARQGAPAVLAELAKVADDMTMPVIARATAVHEMGGVLDAASLLSLATALGSEHALIRRAAAESLALGDPATRWRLLSTALNDPVRSVRLAAASNLLDLRASDVEPGQRESFASALREFEQAQLFNAERAESWVNLARLHVGQGQIGAAEQDFLEARRRDRRYVPIFLNQADLYRALRRERDAERVLNEGLGLKPDAAALRHSLGLLYIRTGRGAEAMTQLAAAHRLEPESARFGYVYGVALQSTGKVHDAIAIWRETLAAHPWDRDILTALTLALRDVGDREGALGSGRRLAELFPDDADVARLVRSLDDARTPD